MVPRVIPTPVTSPAGVPVLALAVTRPGAPLVFGLDDDQLPAISPQRWDLVRAVLARLAGPPAAPARLASPPDEGTALDGAPGPVPVEVLSLRLVRTAS